MPEENPNTDLIMVATGTGIAPYRGFIRRLFVEKTPAAEAYDGGPHFTTPRNSYAQRGSGFGEEIGEVD